MFTRKPHIVLYGWIELELKILLTTIIDSVSVVTDSDPIELVINYGNTTVIMDPEESNQDYLKLLWTTKPESVVYAFPIIFAFAQNSLEVRLAINGNLLATHYLPGVKLLASKEHIIFAAEEALPDFSNRLWSLYRIRNKGRTVVNQGRFSQKAIDTRIAVLQLDKSVLRGGSVGSTDSGMGNSWEKSGSTSSVECSVPPSPMYGPDPFGDIML